MTKNEMIQLHEEKIRQIDAELKKCNTASHILLRGWRRRWVRAIKRLRASEHLRILREENRHGDVPTGAGHTEQRTQHTSKKKL